MNSDPATPATGAGRILVWLFAGVGVLATLAVIWLAAVVTGIGDGAPHREPARVAAKGETETYSVQDVRDVPGTGLVQIAVGIPGREAGGAYSSSDSYSFDHRNLILLDKATGASRRLLADNRRRIMEFRFFPAVAAIEGALRPADEYAVEVEDAQGGKTAPPPAAYYVLAVRRADSERQDVLIGNIAGGRQAFLLNDIDGIDRMWMLAPDRLAMVVRVGMNVRYKVINVPALKRELDRAVEI